MVWEYIKAALMLAVILAASWYLVRRRGRGAAKSADIRVLGARSLGRERQLVVAEVAGRVYILGVTAQHVERIDSMTGDEYRAACPAPAAEPAAARPFAQELAERLLGRWEARR